MEVLEEKRANNSVLLCGTLGGKAIYSHSSRDEKYFTFPLNIDRLSGAVDTINIIAREDLINSLIIEECEKIIVKGELRSFNNKSGVGNRLIITVFAREIEFGYGNDHNDVELTGVICKPSIYRKTPMGREICDIMLAVNRRYGRSDYLPCIVWGQNAVKASGWTIGSRVSIMGRIQSRKYIKAIGNESREKTVYEISAISIELIEPRE